MNQSVKLITEDLTVYLRQLITLAEGSSSTHFCKLSCLFVFLCKLSKVEDKRVAQKIFDIYKKQTLDLTLGDYNSSWNFVKFWE